MSESYWAYWLVLLGVVFTVIMMLIQSVTTSNTQDYYQLKEVTESAMVDAVDYAYYRLYGEVKINKEKFVENFIRRFAETVSITTTYQIDFYDLYEAPPKVSVKVKSLSNSFNIVGDETSFNVVNKLDAILETNVNSGPNGGMCSYYSEDHSDDYDDSNPEDEGGEETPGPTDDEGGGDEDCDKCDDKFKDDEEDPVDPEPDDPEEPEEPDNPEKLSICKEGIRNYDLEGKPGTSMSNDNLIQAKIYGSDYCNKAGNYCKNAIYTNSLLNEVAGFATPGDVFTINGSSGKWWSIEFDNGDCGWVDSTYMGIDLTEYLPEEDFEFQIKNASGSIYNIDDNTIKDLTGVKLYTGDFNSFVPATYPFAQKLKEAGERNRSDLHLRYGKLVIYDAYRPYGVSKYMLRTYTDFSNYDEESRDLFEDLVEPWGINWFVSTGYSKHNTGCAVDITFKNVNDNDMPSSMHDLSINAVIRKGPNDNHESEGYKKSDAAQALHYLMVDLVRLNDLASEWWHYQSNSCHEDVMVPKTFERDYGNDYRLNFWSNVG